MHMLHTTSLVTHTYNKRMSKLYCYYSSSEITMEEVAEIDLSSKTGADDGKFYDGVILM